MPSTTNAPPEVAVENLPGVPLTIEGASVLHQMMRVRWTAWKAVPVAQRSEIVREAATALADMERNPSGQSAAFFLLGHKGDLIIVHFRQSFEELGRVAGTIRVEPENVHLARGAGYRALFAGMEHGNRRGSKPVARSHASPPFPRHPAS
jgi:hypothetical protein